MTPTILLYILDGLDDLTTVLFSHYFIIDHCAPTILKSSPPPRYTWTRLYNGGPLPPMLRIGPPPISEGGDTHGPCY